MSYKCMTEWLMMEVNDEKIVPQFVEQAMPTSPMNN